MTEELQDYIHQQIPISAAMGICIAHADVDEVRLTAPLAPNINHRETVFGGSAAAVATLAAWTLLLVRLRRHKTKGRLVIAQNSMTYLKPISADFEAVASAKDLMSWEKFMRSIGRKQKGRITAKSTLQLDGDTVAAFEGQFVLLAASTEF